MFLSKEDIKKIGFKSVGDNVFISDKASIYSPNIIEIGSNVRIDDFCILSPGSSLKIGSYVHIACYVSIIGAGEIIIEDFAGLSGRVSLYSSNDDYRGTGMTNPMVPEEYRNVTTGKIHIKKHVILGAGTIVLPNVTIGMGSSINAYSIVTRDCEELSIYAGITAKKLKNKKNDFLKYEPLVLNKKEDNTIAFTYNPHIHFESYKNTLFNLRKHYPDADVFVYLDSFRSDLIEFFEIGIKYNCNIIVSKDPVFYINREDSLEINLPKMKEWINRLEVSCTKSDAKWMMLLEDDVLIKRKIKKWPEADCGKNRHDVGFLGGGSIFKREKFLQCYEKEKNTILKLISENPTHCWGGDILLANIFRNNGATEEKWIELAEPSYFDDKPHAIYHGYKYLHNK